MSVGQTKLKSRSKTDWLFSGLKLNQIIILIIGTDLKLS